MLNVCCGTKNPSKLKGIGHAFSEFFKDLKITGIEVSNSVGPQPIGIDKTMKGAKTRAELPLKFESGCDFGVGVEAGIIKINEDYYNIVASFILDRENNGSFGFSPAFGLPHKFVKNLINGKYSELEQIADSYFRTKNIGEGIGIIGILTAGKITREVLTYYAVMMSLVPFLNKELYNPGSP
uniref:Probable inosine/xanthosine triphosphatase n=1 Tax=Fervidicoccus fontis TaxID=683846 RepID=A0A7J3SN56_9CREN